jgi:hypothetical protein
MVGGVPYAPVPMYVPSLTLVERRINSLAMGWAIYAALSALVGIIGLGFASAAMHNSFGPWGNWGHIHPHWHSWTGGPGMPFFFMKLGWAFLAVRVGLAAAAGYGLMQKTSWGRGVAIVAGILSIIHLPFGTAIGIWTLVVLMNAPNAAGYEAMVRG